MGASGAQLKQSSSGAWGGVIYDRSDFWEDPVVPNTHRVMSLMTGSMTR